MSRSESGIMKKKLLITGDSFCANASGWPRLLAEQLGLELVCSAYGGQHWWPSKKFLTGVDKTNIELLVIAHTFFNRIPTTTSLSLLDHSNLNHNDEQQLAVHLYYKYINDEEFLNWAQAAWFKELELLLPDTKIINLHCFQSSWDNHRLLPGINVYPSLAAISVNELSIDSPTLINDNRKNHLSNTNNLILASKIANMYNNYSPGDVLLDPNEFEHHTTKWVGKF